MIDRKKKDSIAGDCFVVWRTDGTFWDGAAWVPDWQQALQFSGPVDPSAEADRLVAELRRQPGVRCNVAYIPRQQTRAVTPARATTAARARARRAPRRLNAAG